jgi:phosphate butyryltransferase
MLKSLSALVDIAKTKKKRRLVVAAAADEPVLNAVFHATKEGIIEPILVGEKSAIEFICQKIGFDISSIEIIDEPNAVKASAKAVAIIKEGRAEILMKGLVATGPLLKAVLNNEHGLRKGATLSHIALFESPFYHKLIAVTDAAMNVAPEFSEKVDIVNNAVEAYHKLGEKLPKVAILAAVEVINPKMEETIHASMLTTMNKRGQIKGCIIDGPLALDNAISYEAAEHKGIISEVAGDADILVTPEIVSGNILYKSFNFLGGATAAAVIMGAKVPIVLTSRADSEQSKMMSIALAAAME